MTKLDEQLKDRARNAATSIGSKFGDHADDTEIIHSAMLAAIKLYARMGPSIALKCPLCEDVGYYVVSGTCGEPEMEQCEFCYTTPNSLFNVRAMREAQLKEVLGEKP